MLLSSYLVFYIFFITRTNKHKETFSDVIKICPINLEQTKTDIYLNNKDTNNNYGILKSTQKDFYNNYLTKEEIDLSDLELIISKLKSQFENNQKIKIIDGVTNYTQGKHNYDNQFISYNKKINSLFEDVKKWIMESLNESISVFLLNTCIKSSSNYEIIKEEVISINSNYQFINFKFSLIISKRNSEIPFNIFFNVIMDKNNLNKYINGIRVMGILAIDDIYINNKEETINCFIDDEYCSLRGECATQCNKLLSVDNVETKNIFLETIINEEISTKLYSLYKCYKNIMGYKTLTKDNNKHDCEKNNGTFDRQCTFNEECPFYKSNRNYKNDRGKCVYGLCEFPVGIERISPRSYDKKSKPFCHKCKNGGYNCCDDQYDRSSYPNLKSPHYIFEKDNII